MNLNLDLLNSKIEQTHISKSDLAEALGLTRQGLYNKLNGENEFKGSEIKIISKMLNLTIAERDNIFFADYVDENSTKS